MGYGHSSLYGNARHGGMPVKRADVTPMDGPTLLMTVLAQLAQSNI
jgi:hypothetical protein